MKKHIAMLCAVLLTALAAFAPGAAAAGPALTATEAYCIIDADTGLVLAQQNMNEELHPASITKVMTLGLACEKAQGKWDNVKLTVSHEDVYSLAGTDSSHIALQEGEDGWLTLSVPGWVNSIIVNGSDGSVQTSDLSVETGKDLWIVVSDAENAEVTYEAPAETVETAEAPAAESEPTVAAEPAETKSNSMPIVIGVVVVIAVVAGGVVISKKKR